MFGVFVCVWWWWWWWWWLPINWPHSPHNFSSWIIFVAAFVIQFDLNYLRSNKHNINNSDHNSVCLPAVWSPWKWLASVGCGKAWKRQLKHKSSAKNGSQLLLKTTKLQTKRTHKQRENLQRFSILFVHFVRSFLWFQLLLCPQWCTLPQAIKSLFF